MLQRRLLFHAHLQRLRRLSARLLLRWRQAEVLRQRIASQFGAFTSLARGIENVTFLCCHFLAYAHMLLQRNGIEGALTDGAGHQLGWCIRIWIRCARNCVAVICCCFLFGLLMGCCSFIGQHRR